MLLGCFAIIPYPISIHRQTNDLIDLIQQDVLRDIIPYASHNLLPKSAINKPNVRGQTGKVKLKYVDKDLLVGIEIIRS